jgi:hypothetical protein
MWANYVVTAAWGGRWAPRIAARFRRLAAWLELGFTVPGAGARHGAAARRARFEQEARAAARAWLMV